MLKRSAHAPQRRRACDTAGGAAGPLRGCLRQLAGGRNARIRRPAGRPAGPGAAASARPSCRGTGRYSGHMPIRTFSTTRSGPLAMTTVSGPMPMTISSTACSGASRPAATTAMRRRGQAAPGPRPSNAAVQELCTQPGTGITAWPFAEINSKVGLNADQKQLLDQVRSAGQKAAAVFKASCPAANDFARTPTGRLQAMTLRLGARSKRCRPFARHW